nr:MAG: DNA pilot protein [Microvirus sp.]
METNNNNNNATASSVAAGIGPAVAGIFNNLWSAKERRRNQAWNEKQLANEQKFNTDSATTAYNRSIDYNTQMQAYKNAGINPYMVASNGVQPSMASSAHTNPTPQAKFDFTSIGQIPMQIMQLKLLQAQKENIDADTVQKSTGNEQAKFNLEMDQKFKDSTNTETLQQIKNTNANLEKSNQLIQSQTSNQYIQNSFTSMQAKWYDTMRTLETDNMIKHNSYMSAQINQVNKLIQKLTSDIELNQSNTQNNQDYHQFKYQRSRQTEQSIQNQIIQIDKTLQEIQNMKKNNNQLDIKNDQYIFDKFKK